MSIFVFYTFDPVYNYKLPQKHIWTNHATDKHWSLEKIKNLDVNARIWYYQCTNHKCHDLRLKPLPISYTQYFTNSVFPKSCVYNWYEMHYSIWKWFSECLADISENLNKYYSQTQWNPKEKRNDTIIIFHNKALLSLFSFCQWGNSIS